MEQQVALTSFLILLAEFKKFLQRRSNSLYNFETPVIMKVGARRPLKPGPGSSAPDPPPLPLCSVLRPSSTFSSWN